MIYVSNEEENNFDSVIALGVHYFPDEVWSLVQSVTVSTDERIDFDELYEFEVARYKGWYYAKYNGEYGIGGDFSESVYGVFYNQILIFGIRHL